VAPPGGIVAGRGIKGTTEVYTEFSTWPGSAARRARASQQGRSDLVVSGDALVAVVESADTGNHQDNPAMSEYSVEASPVPVRA
jgi:hypothetical protein